jgi:hypothetical protein
MAPDEYRERPYRKFTGWRGTAGVNRARVRGISVSAYRLYHIDGSGHFSTAEWIEADDDALAIKAAKGRARSGTCEVWHGSRLVGRVGPGGEAPQSGRSSRK